MNSVVKANLVNIAMKKVLFVCAHNSGRSQMAEALFNHYSAGTVKAFSAGTRPASHTDRTVVEAMREVGIDTRSQHPKMLCPDMLEDTDKVITMGCGAESIYPAAFVSTEDWQLEDPEGKPIEKVREIRDEIKAKVKKLINEIQYAGR